MVDPRAFDLLVLAALACLGVLAVGRGAMLSRRGVPLLAIDRERSLAEGLADLGFVLCFGLWLYESLAFALPLDRHLVPASLLYEVAPLDTPAVRVLGALCLLAGVGVYGLALHGFGSSWRLGIDRERPGPLVTGGIFARSRNPIYLGLSLVAAGVFAALGARVLLLLALLFVLYFRQLIRREERFLAQHYGEAYLDYTRRVARWWTWRARDRPFHP